MEIILLSLRNGGVRGPIGVVQGLLLTHLFLYVLEYVGILGNIILFHLVDQYRNDVLKLNLIVVLGQLHPQVLGKDDQPISDHVVLRFDLVLFDLGRLLELLDLKAHQSPLFFDHFAHFRVEVVYLHLSVLMLPQLLRQSLYLLVRPLQLRLQLF